MAKIGKIFKLKVPLWPVHVAILFETYLAFKSGKNTKNRKK